MQKYFRPLIRSVLGRFGYEINRTRTASTGFPVDFDKAEAADIISVLPFTLTTPERMVGLIRALRYLVSNRIPGDIVECGVYEGGSMMLAAKTLMRLGDTERQLWLYDTFEGMPEPGEKDVSVYQIPAQTDMKGNPCRCSLEAVRSNLRTTSYPQEKVHYVKGKIEETVPRTMPTNIALLRLDTDWYSSTKHELVHLYPQLTSKGILIIDDYGHWLGARQAVDEYLKEKAIPMFLNRMDYTGRLGVKP
jgi:hypothetical protein